MSLTDRIRVAYENNGGNVSETARQLGIKRDTVRNHRRRWQAEASLRETANSNAAKVRLEEKPRTRVRNGRMTVMVIGDAHDSPGMSKDRFSWMGKFAADERPPHIVQIGDLFTLDSLNTHISNSSFNGRAKGTFLADMASGNEALQRFNSELPSDYSPVKHVTLGNHERRAYLFQDNAPETSGMLQGELEGVLTRNGWSFSPYGKIHFLGGVGFVHCALNRLGKSYGGKNAEMSIANDAVFDLVLGHSHTARTWKAPKIGPSKHIMVVNVGCALPQGHIEDYAAHSTTGWSWGLTMLGIENGQIVDHQFVSMSTLEARYS